MDIRNKNLTLVVMAAGMGSRFGGLKQTAKITDKGSTLLDFSIYDAIEAGFNECIFIIRKDIENEFKELVGKRISKKINVKYAFQDIDKLPKGRTKPFGTSDAILCIKDIVKNSFAVINADDFYGKEAFQVMADFLLNKNKNNNWAMVSYQLGKTLSKIGDVSRGVCKVENGLLKDIKEIKNINYNGEYIENAKKVILNKNELVSMNLWGFTLDIFPLLKQGYDKFIKTANLLKDEFLLPNSVEDALKQDYNKVYVLKTKSKWFGMTYREDLEYVKKEISKLIKKGYYKGL